MEAVGTETYPEDRTAVLLTQDDINGIVPIREIVAGVEQAYVDWGAQRSLNYLCRRIRTPENVRVCVHQGAAPSMDVTGLLVHCEHVVDTPDAESYVHASPPISVLFAASDGHMAGLIIGEPTSQELPEVRAVAGLRTAGTSVVGTNAMAPPEASTLGVIGTGRQAAVHVVALAASRSLTSIEVFSRDARRRETFAESMTANTGVPVSPSGDAEQVVRDNEVILTATNSSVPVIDGGWLSPGQHVTSIVGGTVGLAAERRLGPGRRELDEVTDERATSIGLASFEQSVYGFEEIPSDELVAAYESARGAYRHWGKTVDLSELVTARRDGRRSGEDITVFKNNAGQGLGDVAVGMLVLRQAAILGRGTPLQA